MAGYSPKSLADKLGLQVGMTASFFNPPDPYFELLGERLGEISTQPTFDDLFEFIHLFTSVKRELIEQLPVLLEHLALGGMIWISWPKKASGIPSQVTEDTIREVALPLHLVDVKVCAIDDTWSGLKLVRRKK